MEKLTSISARLGIAFLCMFWGYICLAVFPGLDVPLNFTDWFVVPGELWVGIALVQLVGIGLVWVKANYRRWGEIALNIMPIFPVFYYFYLTSPQGVS